MGRDSVKVVEVTASVSRHNSSQDTEDDALVDELRQRIVDIVSEERYKNIRANC